MATTSPLRTAFEAKRPRPWIGLLAIRVLGERYEAGMGGSYAKSGGSGRRSSPDTPPPATRERSSCLRLLLTQGSERRSLLSQGGASAAPLPTPPHRWRLQAPRAGVGM